MKELRRLWGYFWRFRLLFFCSVFSALIVAICTTSFTTLVMPLYQSVLSPESLLTSTVEDAVPETVRGSVPDARSAGEPESILATPPAKENVISLVNRYVSITKMFNLGHEHAFLEVPFFFLLLFVVKGGFSFLAMYLMDFIGLKVILELRHEIYRKITYQAMTFFSAHQTGELISRVTNDINRLQSTSAKQFADLVQFSLILVGQVFLMLYLDWKLALICGVLLPLAIYPVIRFGRRMRRVSRRSQERMADVADRLHETISGARVVTGFNMQEREVGRFRKALDLMFHIDVKGIKVLALTPPVMELAGASGGAVLIWYAGSRIRGGSLAPEVLMAFLTALGVTYVIIKRFSRINNHLQQALAAAKRVFQIIDTEVAVTDKPGAPVISSFDREIRYRNVSFAYGDNDILSGIDISIQCGQVVALVGSSGAGKTTMVNLIPRFFDVTNGSLELDGQDVRDVTVTSLREQISIVTQEIILFNETVRDNIAYGRMDAPQTEVIDAAKAAFAHDFIMQLPEGYETVIGERGHFLSVGQRQRIAIARALLKDSPILILDEATSALDSESEVLVQNALSNLMQGRTVVVIAHRLSTIRKADTILVLENGRIAERGSHQELLGIDGTYARLHRLQFHDPSTVEVTTGPESGNAAATR